MTTRLWLFWSDLGWDSNHIAPLGVVWGLFAVSHGKTLYKLGLITAISLVLNLGVFLYLANVDVSEGASRYVLSRFWPQAYLCCYALGSAALRHSIMASGLPPYGQAGVLLAVLAGIGYGAAGTEPQYQHERVYVESVLQSLPRGSLLLLQGDTPMYVGRYLQV